MEDKTDLLCTKCGSKLKMLLYICSDSECRKVFFLSKLTPDPKLTLKPKPEPPKKGE